jgi:TRAP-type C4-dicarboxylate transport system permease small subunit
MWGRVLNGLNWLLVANLFFVLASFGWFATAVMGRSFNVDLGLDIWYSLWTPLFQPAIGVLMAGAIAIGLLRWVSNKLTALQDNQP